MTMDYSESTRVKATVDWIDIQVRARTTTNFRTMRRAFGNALRMPEACWPHVRPISPGAGGETMLFVVRIHDVRRFSQLRDLHARACLHVNLEPDFLIVGIEIALDYYSDDPVSTILDLYCGMTRPVSENRRLYRDFKGSGQAIPRREEALRRYISGGWQLGIGNQNGERYQHLYLKDTDTLAGQRVQVEPRARFEIRLADDGLPCQAQWDSFQFERLAEWFYIRQVRSDLAPVLRTLVEDTGQFGERKVRNRAGGGTRLYGRLTEAHPLNEKTRSALRNLSRRWKN